MKGKKKGNAIIEKGAREGEKKWRDLNHPTPNRVVTKKTSPKALQGIKSIPHLEISSIKPTAYRKKDKIEFMSQW
jgi:hypothetical protein